MWYGAILINVVWNVNHILRLHAKERMTLGEYVKKVMGEKHLNAKEVERRSKKQITDSYVLNIINGTAKNLTVEKLQALAIGLGVDEEEVFRIARGQSIKREIEPWPTNVLLDTMREVVNNPDLTNIVKGLVKRPNKIKAVMKLLDE